MQSSTLQNLQEEKNSLEKEYQEKYSEYAYYKKEADRLSKLAQKKRDSQKTLDRYMQNELETKQKKKDLIE